MTRNWTRRVPFVLLGLLTLAIVPALGQPPGDPAPELTCPSCDDFNGCTVDSCNTTTGTCRFDPLNCDDHNPCTIDSCTPGQFSNCQHTNAPNGTACDDHEGCTIADMCTTGVCRGTFLPLGSSCNDGNGCTESDTCQAGGICRGAFLNPGDACDDGNACTSGGSCVDEAGTLVCRSAPTNACDDLNPCTQDVCDPTTGLCGAHPPVSCDDGNPCTTDGCDMATGQCLVTFAPGNCDDHDICTTNDACSAGNCMPGAPLNCDDGNICTVDFCHVFDGGCSHQLNTTPGICGISTNPCFADPRCNPITLQCNDVPKPGAVCGHAACLVFTCTAHGACLNAAPEPGAPCDDSNPCTTGDVCSSSAACVGTPLCDDHDPCTRDTCDGAGGCIFTPGFTIQVSLTPTLLSPANHGMVAISALVTATDICGGTPQVRFTSITSSEPDDAPGMGDGHTTDDIQDAAIGTADFNFLLRAERAAHGHGRTYTVTYTATSSGGSTISATSAVLVPKDQKQAPANRTRAHEPGDEGKAGSPKSHD